MRFSCDRCGKRYTSVDEPVPGRIYRVRCGRCGEVMRVTAALPDAAPEPEAEAGPAVVAADAADARAALDSALLRQAREAGVPPPVGRTEETDEIPIDLGLSDEFPLARRHRTRRAFVAIAATAAVAAAAIAGALLRTGSTRDANASAASAGRSGSPAPPAPPAAGPEAAPAPSAAVPGAPPAAPARVAPVSAGEDRRRHRPAVKPPEVGFEPRASPSARRPAGVDAGLAEALGRKQDVPVTTGLPDVTELQAALDARRGDLDRCAQEARGTSAAALWAGRTPQIVVTVQPGGQASARIDDAALEATDLAACLRRVAARTAFPAFRGDPVELRTPAPVP